MFVTGKHVSFVKTLLESVFSVFVFFLCVGKHEKIRVLENFILL